MIFLGVIFPPLGGKKDHLADPFCACLISFIGLEVLMPSNCSGAQAAATAAIVKYKPKNWPDKKHTQ